MRRGEPFSHPKFVLCEGIEDAAFIRAMFVARAHPISTDISSCHDMHATGGGGNSRFWSALGGCEAATGFDAVRKVLFVADNDDDPAASFEAVCKQIKKAKDERLLTRPWATPLAPATLVNGDPAVVVWMWPAPGVQGCLETLLWGAIEGQHPDRAACVLAAFACSGANGWPTSKRHKAFVRCYFSLYCKENPAATLSTIWNDPVTGALMPLGHASLDQISGFLAAF